MRAYVIVTGAIFGAIVVSHVWRMVSESPTLASDPAYLALTLVSAALAIWAVRLSRRRG
jgi:hypothetical protein